VAVARGAGHQDSYKNMTLLATSTREELVWRVLCLLNLYRLLVPAILFVLYVLAASAASLGWAAPRLFLATDLIYFLLAIVAIVALKMRRPALDRQAWLHLGCDLIAIALLMYASGGVSSGLGILLVVPVGAVSLISRRRRGFVVAASATLAVLVQEVMVHLAGASEPASYTSAGVLGAILFIVALSARPLAERLRESEEQVRQKDIDLANLAELSHYIVQNLRESLLVVDADDRIRLINESAANILGAHRPLRDALLGEVSPRLLYFLEMWRQSPQTPASTPTTFVSADGASVIQPHFATLGKGSPGPVLVFLEDTTLLAERVQQSKLASLGRLSASIAHEIRNPVGALSHAGQLLGESPNLNEQERRLTEIIRNHSERVSTIINNVLQLSRRDNTAPEALVLDDWVEDFAEEYRQTMQLPAGGLQLRAEHGADPDNGGGLEVRVDPSHLHQVLWNLCDNACNHGAGDDARIEITWGRVSTSGRPFLQVCDRGPGIEADMRDKIFEPFFTASDGGTGLGLFIARELCQCNGAMLLFEPRGGGGSVFRIVFADPQRWVEQDFIPTPPPGEAG
jgi:two-component system sensor histidine kinase PilS (NtrC family)